MADYVIKRKNRNKKIVKFNYDESGFEFKPRIQNPNLISISNLNLFNKNHISSILIKKIDRSFRRLTAIYLSVMNDDDTTSGDAIIALDELAKQKNIIVREYKEYLKKEQQDVYVKRLKAFEKDLKQKLIYIRQLEEEQIEEKSFTR